MALAQFVDRTVAHVRQAPIDFTLLPTESVPGSLFSGGAGVAFFLLEAARLRGEDDLVPLAQRWFDAASTWAETATRTDWMDLPQGFLIGASGLAYVDALLGAREGDASRVLRAVERIENVSSNFDGLRGDFRATELVAGGAGIVCAARDLDARLPRGPEHDAARVVLARLRDRALAAVLEAQAPAIPEDTLDRRGLAHGIAGELWPLVAVLGPDHERVSARLDELAALAERDEEGLVYWLPVKDVTDTAMLGTWCNGMAGQSLLWTEVARRRPTKEAMALAAGAAESVQVLLSLNASLCCGLAGQAMALQSYAGLSGDPRFDKRAYARLSRAAKEAEIHGQEVAMGFWQGTLGVALVAMARLHGERRFPCIEPLVQGGNL